MIWTKSYSPYYRGMGCCMQIFLLFAQFFLGDGTLWDEMGRINDLTEFRRLCGLYTVPKSYLQDSRAYLTVFAEVDDVFIRYPNLRSMTNNEVLSHFADVQVPEIMKGGKWEKPLLIRNSVQSGKIFVSQFESNPGNFSYFANNGRVCNHVSPSWGLVSENEYLYKICSWVGNEPFRGTAFDFVRIAEPGYFNDKRYTNTDLTQLRDIMLRVPDVSMIIFGGSAWNGFHTFFLPNNRAFEKVTNKNLIDRDILLCHVSSTNRVLFTESWLYDYGTHYYPSIRFATNVIEDNFRLMLTMKNLTDRKTGRWDVYAVSNVFERYSVFRKGAVWAKIITPNIPMDNGAAHIIDSVLGLVTETIDQMIQADPKATTLMTYIYTVGQVVRSYFAATGGLITFFAPINEAFDRIPEEVERRLLRDRIWLEQILKLHIVPAKDLTTDQMENGTRANTVDNLRQLYFIKGEWPKNNITYYVIGGGVTAAIYQEDVAAVNGIIQYIDRVLGVPYDTMYNIMRNETSLQTTYKAIDHMQLKYALNPWQVLRPEQNFTFFIPTEEAWDKMPPRLRNEFFDGYHWQALQFVLKRHIIQGQALMLTDLRERQYIMMNDQLVLIRRRDRWFELYWPYGNIVARLYEGGEIAAINGFMHRIDNVLVLEEDLKAAAVQSAADFVLLLISLIIVRFFR